LFSSSLFQKSYQFFIYTIFLLLLFTIFLSAYNLNMSKKPISWLELIKLKLSEEKSKGNSPSINDIMPMAKKDWAQIKSGTHPKYIKGKSQTFARKKKFGDDNKKTRKFKKNFHGNNNNVDIQQILAQVKMCGKCKKKVEKIMSKKNKMHGGYNQFYDVPKITTDGTLTSPPGNALPGVVGFNADDKVYTQYGGKKKKGGKKQKGGCGEGGASCSVQTGGGDDDT
jgi:hypothetical protein